MSDDLFGWGDLGFVMPTVRPSACAWGVNRLDVFWHGGEGDLRQAWYNGTRWREARVPTLGALTGDPAACSMADGRIDLFWRDTSGALRHKWYIDSDGGWVRPSGTVREETLQTAGSIGGFITVASWGPNRIDLFWPTPSGAVFHKWFQDGWTGSGGNDRGGEETLQIQTAGGRALSVCSWESGRLDLFWVDQNASLGHWWWHNGAQGRTPLGSPTGTEAPLNGPPAACSWAPGVLDVFVRGHRGTLWHRSWDDGTWHEWRLRNGSPTGPITVTSWGDGRLDLFCQGSGRKLHHGWYGGMAATRNPAIQSLWDFIRNFQGSDKIRRLLNAFAAGRITSGNSGSGAMISPHLFMTAAHVGGPGWSGTVSLFHSNTTASQHARDTQRTIPYPAKSFPWQDQPGDTVLYWLNDGPDGLPPGLKYGYQEMSPNPVLIGQHAYSFWTNPALRLQETVLYSSGPATSQGEGDWQGAWTNYAMYGVEGSSGSTVLSGEHLHGHRVVGGTQSASDTGGPWRGCVNAVAFLSRHSKDSINSVVDAVEYDWLMTRPIQPFYLIDFKTEFGTSCWLAVPNGSGTSIRDDFYLSGNPRMAGGSANWDGFWHQYARFRPNAAYRVAVNAKGRQSVQVGTDGASYVRFVSDSTGHEVLFNFTPTAQNGDYVGQVTLGGFGDYRLIVGTRPGTEVEIEAIRIAEVGKPFGFGTHDERRSWSYSGESRPVSWGVADPISFSGFVASPQGFDGSGLLNAHACLAPNQTYLFDFEAKSVSASGSYPVNARIMLIDTANQRVAWQDWSFARAGERKSIQATMATGSAADRLAFTGQNCTYLVGDINISIR